MDEARKEELRLAIESGDFIVDDNGRILGLGTVLADGSWMQKAYHNGSFNSPSGMVFIIGKRNWQNYVYRNKV